MKHMLLFAFMFTLTLGSSTARVWMGNSGVNGSGTNVSDVEGAIINRQKAQAKPGYYFVRQSSKSVSVIKNARGVAAIQTGTLTCVGQPGKTCDVFVNTEVAQCSGGCYFVGQPGGVRAQ